MDVSFQSDRLAAAARAVENVEAVGELASASSRRPQGELLTDSVRCAASIHLSYYTLFLTRFWLPVSPACPRQLAVSTARPSLRSNRSTRLKPPQVSSLRVTVPVTESSIRYRDGGCCLTIRVQTLGRYAGRSSSSELGNRHNEIDRGLPTGDWFCRDVRYSQTSIADVSAPSPQRPSAVRDTALIRHGKSRLREVQHSAVSPREGRLVASTCHIHLRTRTRLASTRSRRTKPIRTRSTRQHTLPLPLRPLTSRTRLRATACPVRPMAHLD